MVKRSRDRQAVRLDGEVPLSDLVDWPGYVRVPRRIQLSRAKGVRLPLNAVVVARPSRWGNPFQVRSGDRAEAVELYESWVEALGEELAAFVRQELAGRDLACWCPLNQPCHADVLLRIANGHS